MNFWRKVTARPWEHAGDMEGVHGGYMPAETPGGTGLFFLLAVIGMFFFLFSVTYQSRSLLPDWEAVREPLILWVNTGVLVLASGVLHLARRTAEAGKAPRGLLSAAIVLTVLFVAGQVLAWQQLVDAGKFLYANPANAFFYLFTGLHAAHVLGGLCFQIRVRAEAGRTPDSPDLARRVRFCATYSHFMVAVWAVLFYLLLNS